MGELFNLQAVDLKVKVGLFLIFVTFTSLLFFDDAIIE